MTYHTGVINSANPAVDLMIEIDTHLQAHAAWEFVEELVDDTEVVRVYRCLGSVNGLGWDYYLGVRRSSPTSSVNFQLAENYATGLYSGYIPEAIPNSGAVIGQRALAQNATNYRANGTVNYDAAPTDELRVCNDYSIAVVVSGAFSYHLMVTPRFITIGREGTAVSGAFYLGYFEPIAPNYDEKPIVAINIGLTYIGPRTWGNWSSYPDYTSYGGFPRMFGGNSSADNTKHEAFHGRWSPFDEAPVGTIPANGSGIKHSLLGKWLPSRIYVATCPYTGLSSMNGGTILRGWIPADVLQQRSAVTSTAVNGDTMDIDGESYRRISNSVQTEWWVREVA